MSRNAVSNILTDRLHALSDMLRLRMLRLLESNELSVGEVAKVFQLPQSTVSRHLTTLAKAGWLVKRQMGTATFYSLTLDDLDRDARGVWVVVRDQIAGGPETEEDDHRLEGVLAERRMDSVSFFGRVGGEWDAIRNELFGERLTALGLLSLLHADWTVADIGCGTGNAAELLAGSRSISPRRCSTRRGSAWATTRGCRSSGARSSRSRWRTRRWTRPAACW